MSIEDKTARVNVVGSGVMGLSLVLELLQDGYTDIHLFDRKNYSLNGYLFSKGCDSASSDINKVFKTGYGAKVHYQKMAEKSLNTFLAWNEQIKRENWESGSPLYVNSGFLTLNVPKKALMGLTAGCLDINAPGSVMECSSRGLGYRSLDPFNLSSSGKSVDGVLDTTAGLAYADKSCRWVLHLIRKLNTHSQVKFHWGQSVKILTQAIGSTKKAVGVLTSDGVKHLAPLTVVAAGPWAVELVPEAKEKLEVAAGTIALFRVNGSRLADRFKDIPTWVYSISGGSIYGFPLTSGYLKIGFRGIKFTNPEVISSTMGNEKNFPLAALDAIKGFVRDFIPEITRVSSTRLCWHADTTDNEFLISYVPHYSDKSLFIIGGDSGHAFKMLGSLGSYSLAILKGRGDPELTKVFSWDRARPEKPRYQNKLDNTILAGPSDMWIHQQCKL